LDDLGAFPKKPEGRWNKNIVSPPGGVAVFEIQPKK